MSLILEALKKSEAKRRLGEAPDLGTPFAAPRRRRVVLPAVIVLIAAALVWWGFFSGRTAPLAGRGADNQMAGQSATAGQRSGAPLRAVAGDTSANAGAPKQNLSRSGDHAPEANIVAASPTSDANETPPVAASTHRVSEADRSRREATMNAPPPVGAAAPRRPSRQGVQHPPEVAPTAPFTAQRNAIATTAIPAGANPTPSTRAAPIAAPATPSAVQPSVAATAPPSVTITAPAQRVAPAAAPLTAPKTVDVAPATPETRAPKGPGTIGAPPSTAPVNTPVAPAQSAQPYSELAFSVRKSLPELRLSMHVYTADPAQRFVILNDSRLGEGEKTTDDVFVREVRPDGVVLEFQSQRFFYPRDGL